MVSKANARRWAEAIKDAREIEAINAAYADPGAELPRFAKTQGGAVCREALLSTKRREEVSASLRAAGGWWCYRRVAKEYGITTTQATRLLVAMSGVGLARTEVRNGQTEYYIGGAND